MFAALLHSAGQSDAEHFGQGATTPDGSVPSLSSPQALDEFRQLVRHLQTAIAEFYAAQMRYPVSLQEIGANAALPPSVRSVRIGATGAVNIPATVQFDLAARDLGGHGIYLLLRVDTGSPRWECVSTDIASISALLPDCAYTPGYNPPAVREPPLQPPWQGLYAGTIGGVPVVAEFWQVRQTFSSMREASVPIEGLYYYRRHARSLSLLPAAERDTLLECPASFSGTEACAQPTGIWTVTVTEERVTGIWQVSADGSPKEVDLTRRGTGKRLAPDVYYAMQHEDQRLSIASDAKRHGVVWKTERHGFGLSGVTGSIVLLDSPVAAARERINRRLMKYIRYPDSARECARHPEACNDGQDVDVLFANERLFAVGGSSYSSGGVHPTSGFGAITFDLRSGRELDWSRIVRINDPSTGTAKPLDLRRRDLLASHVLRAAMKDDGCASSVAAYYGCAGDVCTSGPDAEDRTWILYPTIDGLAVAADVYSEAARGCRGEGVIVPWPEVRETLLLPMLIP